MGKLIANFEIFALIAAFLRVPTTGRLLTIQEARAERTNNNFSCTKRRLAPAKIDDKAGQTFETIFS